MTTKTTTHNFSYTKEDIENLIKYDIARQLEMETIPIISYSISFNVSMEYSPDDWRGEFSQIPTFKGVDAKVELPG